MKNRPTSITVVAWILIVLGAISLISVFAMMKNPMALEMMRRSPIPVPVQWVMQFAGLLVMIVSGIALLKGRNWARFLYVGWTSIGFVIALATAPMKAALIPGLVIFLIISVFLFLPKANQYFAPSEMIDDAQRA